ncbi:hypothetical protein T492DRAFT_899614 [Pavlovales sp. CCMP2436]|nr:hypothetical protein T492DRAFT_899614 [Pavlovales sp. CCMP2436]
MRRAAADDASLGGRGDCCTAGLTKRLESVGAPFAVIGGVACNAYGHRRATQDVDILVNAKDIEYVHDSLVGKGWTPRYAHARRSYRDRVHGGVHVNVLCGGEYPGDGLPKPVAFPDPLTAGVELVDGVRVLTLHKLIELKLASGTSAPASRQGHRRCLRSHRRE